uniref:CCHC-type domain-containing protein n=1 Tax=Setaria italica TaxID=4555 RepID=K3YMN0_SETIT
MEEDPRELWKSLSQRYEQQKTIVLPKATHEWNHLCLQDFKTVDEYNHVVHNVCSKLRFCDKEPSDEDKIEKTLSTMLPSERSITQQYRERKFIVYSSLIQALRQVEKNHEISVWNSTQRPLGTAPLPEVHANPKRARKPRGNFKKGKGISKPKNDNSNKITCYRCGCYNHVAKKCRTPKHLVDLYMKSIGQGQNSQKYEAHFTSQVLETGAMDPIPHGAGPSDTKTPPIEEDNFLDVDNMLVEYASNDMFGDII